MSTNATPARYAISTFGKPTDTYEVTCDLCEKCVDSGDEYVDWYPIPGSAQLGSVHVDCAVGHGARKVTTTYRNRCLGVVHAIEAPVS